MMMGYGFDGPLGWLGMGIGIFVHLAFVGLIVLAAIWMFRAVFLGKSGDSTPASLEILKQRFAKGEINRDEYQQLKHDLT
jgi:putative membrane protein